MALSELGKKRISGGFRVLGSEAWFHDGDKDFYEYAEELMVKGFTEEEALDFLEKVHNTVAHEYGD